MNALPVLRPFQVFLSIPTLLAHITILPNCYNFSLCFSSWTMHTLHTDVYSLRLAPQCPAFTYSVKVMDALSCKLVPLMPTKGLSVFEDEGLVPCPVCGMY